MRRIHLIEFHDQAWFPEFLRDQITADLQILLNTPHLYRVIVPRLQQALENADTRRVVDLCSGAGGPWSWLYDELQRAAGKPIELRLTDKFPNAEAFHRAVAVSGGAIQFEAEPVDATQIPERLAGFRTLFASFHHFRPGEARAILRDAVRKGQGIGVFEVPGRHALTLLLTLFVPVADLFIVPLRRPFLWSRLIWTYAIPVIPLVLLFDGLVSCLRVYSPKQLTDLTNGLTADGYQWQVGEARNGIFSVPITYVIGCPASASRGRGDGIDS